MALLPDREKPTAQTWLKQNASIERLAQLLLNLGDLYGREEMGGRVIERRITHDEVAAFIGSTRQWVTMMLKRFQTDGILAVDKASIRILRPERLVAIVQAVA